MSNTTRTGVALAARPTGLQTFAMALLRIGVGWHFAYEGLVKLFGNWTSEAYLRSADWIGADVFHWMASNGDVLRVVDLLNVWGLLLIGAALMLGLATRLAAVSGMVLLALYYVAHPTLFATPTQVAEGSYLIVNKNLVELLALGAVAVLPASRLGLDGLFLLWRDRRRARAEDREASDELGGPDPDRTAILARRRVLASFAGVPFVGAFAAAVMQKHGLQGEEDEQLAARIDAMSGPSMKKLSFETLDQLKANVPTAPIGGIDFSRVILGGNLMNGFAHARDLIYVSNLIKAYHSEDKIFETFRLAEACGINTILTNPILAPMITGYWERAGGQIKFIAQCKGTTLDKLLDTVKYSIDQGACAAYVQGANADRYVEEGKFDWIEKALQLMRDNGLPAGIGGHKIATIKGAVEQGFYPEFWVKTLHTHKYWSANVENQHDNLWCEDPEETIAFMETLPQPWIAFKVLAAGSIKPTDGFRYAFENGADFICVGMYDFQVVEDANIAVDLLGEDLKRRRTWRV